MRQSLITNFRKVSEAVAIKASCFNGHSDPEGATRAAARAMRQGFGGMNMSAKVVVGQLEAEDPFHTTDLDTPIAAGEILGRGGDSLDMALDPIEGAHLCAKNQPNAITAIAFAPRNTMMHVPDMGYLAKFACGPGVEGVSLGVEYSVEHNIRAVARGRGKAVEDVVVCILDRPRHKDLIRQVHEAGARVRLIYDGDIQASIATAIAGTGVDIYLGEGGPAEGLLACAAIKSIGGFFQSKYVYLTDEQKDFIDNTCTFNHDDILTMDEMVRTRDIHFVATGITNGEMLGGVKNFADGSCETSSLVLSSIEHTTSFVRTIYRGGSIGWEQAEPGIIDSVF